MSEWGYVTFVRHADVDAVEAALGRLFAAEGMKRTDAQPQRRDRYQLQFGSGKSSKYWVIALGAGSPGWTVLRGAPAELLGEPREEGGVPRLAALARELGADAAHFALYDGVAAVIIEADADGRWTLCGYTMEGLEYYGIPIPEERAKIEFERVPVPRRVVDALANNTLTDAYYVMLDAIGGGHDWPRAANALIDGDPLAIPGARMLRFERAAPTPKAVSPLSIAYARDPTRLTLGAGGGEMWIDGWYAHAPDAASGGAFWPRWPIGWACPSPRASRAFRSRSSAAPASY